MILSVLVTIYFWLFLVFVIGGLIFLTSYTVVRSISRNRKLSHLKDWLPDLLRQGYDGSYLSLTDKRTGRTIKFHKYIWGKGNYGLEFRILESEWSESARRKLELLAENCGTKQRLEPSTADLPGQENLVFDFGRDGEAAYGFAAAVWTEVFDLTLKTPFIYDQDEWALVGELIDGPDHPVPLATLSPDERRKEFSARVQKNGLSNLMALYIGFWTLVTLVSAVGCPVAILQSRDQTPDWSLLLGPVSLGGSTSSLVWFAIFCVSFWTCRVLSKRLRRKMGPRVTALTVWEHRTGWLARAFAVTLPIATFLTWAGF